MRKSSLLAAVLLSFCPLIAVAHSIHQSTAEAEYNPVSGKLEVSLTVFVNDLEVALIRQCEREMRIEKTPELEFDAQVKIYIGKHFVVTDAAGQMAPLAWVGRKLDPDSAKSDEPKVTLYFEIERVVSPNDSTLRHSLFLDMFKDQANLLLLRIGKQKGELIFTRIESVKKLSLSGE
jgi:hypothetical protein